MRPSGIVAAITWEDFGCNTGGLVRSLAVVYHCVRIRRHTLRLACSSGSCRGRMTLGVANLPNTHSLAMKRV